MLRLSARAQNRIARRLLRTPAPALRLLFTGRRKRYRGDVLELRTQLMLDLMKVSGRRGLHELEPKRARGALTAMTAPFEVDEADVGEVVDTTVANVPVRIYRGGTGSRPTMLFFHGGGFVLGSIEAYDRVCRFIAQRSKATVVSVGYRLAPEDPYPAGRQDCFAVYDAIVKGALDDVDVDRLMVAGDSAGGNYAAVTAVHARDTGGPLAFQYLVYPTTDMAHPTASYRDLKDGFFLTRELLEWFGDNMKIEDDELVRPLASPLRQESFAGLCPAKVVTAGFDPLRDEGAQYADAMRVGGVEVTQVHYGGMVHGFMSLAGVIDDGEVLLVDMAQQLASL